MDNLVCVVTLDAGLAEGGHTQGQEVHIQSRRLHRRPYRQHVVARLLEEGRALTRASDGVVCGATVLTFAFSGADGTSPTRLHLHPDDDEMPDVLAWTLDSLRERTGRCQEGRRVMVGRRPLVTAGVAGALVVGVAAGTLAGISGSNDPIAQGPAAERAKVVAVESVGGGRAISVEHDPEGNRIWDVEVAKPDGVIVDVELDAHHNVLPNG